MSAAHAIVPTLSVVHADAQLWMSADRICEAAGLTMRTLQRYASKGRATSRPAKIRSRNGKPMQEFLISTLSTELRLKLQPPAPPQLAIVPSPATHGPLFASVEAARTPAQRIVLTPTQEKQARARLDAIQPLLDFARPELRARYSTLHLNDGTRVQNAELLVLYLTQTVKVDGKSPSRETLWRWKSAYMQGGLPALTRKPRADRGTRRWVQQWPEAAKLVTAVYLQQRYSKQKAYNALVRDRETLDIPKEELPSYDAVCDFLASLPKAAVVWAREGEKAHSARFATYLQRGYADIEPNRVWVSDHAIHDVEVRNDCFDGIERDAPMRLRLTALMDLRSRMIVGYTWTPEGSSRSITTVLRQAVLRYGPCETFYCDNGKDFQKVGRFARPANEAAHVDDDMGQVEQSGALRLLGMAVQFCIKYHPQSKPIERLFRTMHLGLDAIMPHYLTGSTATRPDRAVADGAEHRKLLRMGQGHLSQLIPASHFIRMAKEWIENDYNRGHRFSRKAKGMSGQTPAEVFFAGWDESKRRPVDPGVLDMLLWTRQRRLVRNCAVTVNNRRLVGVTERDVEQLYGATESEVIVCFDPNAPETGIVANLDGTKLCDVRAEELVPHSAAAGPMIAASMAERRRLRNNTANSVRKLRREVTAAGHKTEAQLLHERAMLPAAVGEHITQRVAADKPAKRVAPAAPRYAYEIALDALEED